MQDYDSILQAQLPEPIEAAYDSINKRYATQKALLNADVSQIEDVDAVIFMYVSREDIVYLNKKGRTLLQRYEPPFQSQKNAEPPIFWLDEDSGFEMADAIVLRNGQGLKNTRELVTLAWGKTWLEGIKLPIFSAAKQPLAVLFAGEEINAASQIRSIAKRFALTDNNFGEN